MIIRGGIGAEQFRLTGLVLGAFHRVGDQRNGFFQRREQLVALRFIVLDEIATQPEIVTGIGKGLRAQTQFRFDDRADDEPAVHMRPPQHAPHVGNGGRGPVKQAQKGGRHIEVVHLGIFHVAHALIVANRQRQEGTDHRAPINDVAVKQVDRIGDLHQIIRFVDLIDQRVNATGEIIGGGHVHVGAGRAFGSEMRGGGQEAIKACFRLHDLGDQNVCAACDQVGFGQVQAGIAV